MSQEPSRTVPVTELRIGFGRRLVAILLDGIIIAIVSGILALSAGSAFEPLVEKHIAAQTEEMNASLSEMDEEQADMAMGFAKTGIVWGFVATALALVYSLFEIFAAASPGKMMLGIKIANADGTAATTQTLTTRWLVKTGLSSLLSIAGMLTGTAMLTTLSQVIGLVVFLGCFLVLGSNRQALHDMIAKTAVYRREHVMQPESVVM
ncbi:MAG: RDD family protein [Chlorobi bacterium]|nr:RDD family protein [Chlorobiota bacterium]